MKILVINSGSSSLKYQLIDMDDESVKAKGLVERIGIEGTHFKHTVVGTEKGIEFPRNMANHSEAIEAVLAALTDKDNGAIASLDEIGACGHRVLHGGETFKESALVTPESLAEIEALVPLGPLHQKANIAGIRACQEVMPGKPNVAVFDTAFHQTMPPKAYLYGVPYEYYKNLKVRRYGFHGTSHSFVSKKVAEVVGKPYDSLKTIVCHLGNGASISAVNHGKCVDTSMGLTPLEGLIMGTRSGDLDPAIIEFIANKENLTTSEVVIILNKKSGVYALSGELSSDFRDLEDGYKKGNKKAQLAVDAFCYNVAKYVGAYAAAMNGVDVIAFTAGIGENSPFVREKVLAYFGYLGIDVDEAANATRGKDIRISTPDSKVAVYVIPTNEELAIARETFALCK